MELNWITKTRRHGQQTNCDLSITINKNHERDQFHFRLKNGISRAITSNGYIVFAFCQNRIYFNEAQEKDGYKITCYSPDKKACSFKTPAYNKNFVGDYNLLYDKENGLYYIDATRKIGGEK